MVQNADSTALFPDAEGAGVVVTLADGLPGFEACRRFVVVTSQPIEPFTCLQGLDDPQPSFLAIDPRVVVPDYDVALGEPDRARLDARADDVLLWRALVRFDPAEARVNLRAPVVINARNMTGVQLILSESPYAIDHAIPLE